MSNLKQIGLGISQYTQDYDEKLLIQAVGTPNRHFGSILQPYLKSRQIFVCPSAAGSVATTYAVASDGKDHVWTMPDVNASGAADPFTGSYGMNSTVEGLSLSVFTSPSTTGEFFDAAWPTVGAALDGAMANSARHFDGYSICYADGHVKYLIRTKAAVDPTLFYS